MWRFFGEAGLEVPAVLFLSIKADWSIVPVIPRDPGTVVCCCLAALPAKTVYVTPQKKKLMPMQASDAGKSLNVCIGRGGGGRQGSLSSVEFV